MHVHLEDETVNSRVMNLTLILGLITVLVGMTGCSDKDANEWERLVCEVESVNVGSPLLSGYVDLGNDGAPGGDDDTYPIDYVPVVFRARPYSMALTIPEDGPYSWFHITGYNLTWIPHPGAPAELTNYNIVGALCDVIVPVNDDALVTVMIAGRQMKEEAWFSILETNGLSYSANCQLDFIGHESGSDREVIVPGGLLVTFFGAVVPD